MITPSSEPKRLTENGDSPDEVAAGRALLLLREAPSLSSEADARIQLRLTSAKPAPARWILPVSGLLLIAVLGLLTQLWPRDEPVVVPSVVLEKRSLPPVVLTDDVPSMSVVEKVQKPQEPRAVMHSRVKPGVTDKKDVNDALLREAQLLKEAWSSLKLRKLEDTDRVLSLYFKEFPKGALELEAQTAKVKLLLLQNKNPEAIEMIDVLERHPTAHSRLAELHVFRAELLFRQGDFSQSLSLADALDASSLAPVDKERWMFVRAGCLIQLGRVEEARTVLQHYLEVFPQGRFSEKARNTLKGQTP